MRRRGSLAALLVVLPATLSTFLLLFLPLTGCDGGSGPWVSMIQGRMTYNGAPVAGGNVYLAQEVQVAFAGRGLVWQRSSVSNAWGFYSFTGLDAGEYYVYGGRGRSGPTYFSHLSQLSDSLVIDEETRSQVANLELIRVVCDGGLSGMVGELLGGMPPAVPVEGAVVSIWRLEGTERVWVADTMTDADGRYVFENVCTGIYDVYASHEPVGAPEPFPVVGQILDLWFDGEEDLELPLLILGQTIVRKPAIYLYPEREERFRVELVCGDGTWLVSSDPPYGEGWEVTVALDGLIDGRYDYLFYEVSISDYPELAAGWCLERDRLAEQLPVALTEAGLNETERADFMEYWEPLLQDSPWWLVYPVIDVDADAWVELQVTPAPAAVRRVWLFLRGSDVPRVLPAPEIPPLSRHGTVLVEWGGVLAPQPRHLVCR